MSNPTPASNPAPLFVRVAKHMVTSGRGGFPSIGYQAVVFDLTTGEELARSRTVDGVNEGAWLDAGKRLAKRRGYDLRVIDTGHVWHVDGYRLIDDAGNGLVVVRDMRGRVVCTYSSKRPAGEELRSAMYSSLGALVASLGPIVVTAILQYAKKNGR